jgi:hypothetical protein
MTDVVLGSNRFVDCRVIVAIRQHDLLRVATSPLRLSLTTPPDLPSGRSVQVVDSANQPSSAPSVKVISGDKSVAVFWEEAPLVIATLLAESLVSLRADLRSIGINLFDDAEGLHIGTNLFAGNWLSGASTAIILD